MNWYYAVGDEKRGPVEEVEFQSLVQQGVIASDTLIWREGMTEWTRYGAFTASPQSAQTAESSVVCFTCGRTVPQSESFILDGKLCCASCKPQVLARIHQGEPIVSPGAEEMRKQYLKHEASVKSVGLLYYLGGGALLLMGTVAIAGSLSGKNEGVATIVGVLFFVLGGLQLVTAYGVRRLLPWTRIPVGILSGIGLLGFPLGTLINGYILYLVFSQKGSVVFSPEYQMVIAQTPHIKYRTSIVVWILLGLVVALIVLGLTAVFFS